MRESDNIPEVLAALAGYQKKVDLKLAVSAEQIAQRLEGRAKNMIVGQRPEGQKAITGEPPMNRTGALRASIRGYTSRKGFQTYQAIVGADTVYARAVEMGSPYNPPSWKNGERFPYLRPAVDTFIHQGLVQKLIKKNIGSIL